MTNEKEYLLNVQGYYVDDTRGQFPNNAGIYFVYRGILNRESNSCTLKQLLYIGQAENLYQRHNDHTKRDAFVACLGADEMLFYTFAQTDFSEEDRKRVEAALIYELKPTLNTQNYYTFDFPPTKVIVQGNRHAFVPASIEAPSY